MVPEAGLYKLNIGFYHIFRNVLFSRQLEDSEILPCIVHSTYLWEVCDQSVTNFNLTCLMTS